jgi:hypothetical protein
MHDPAGKFPSVEVRKQLQDQNVKIDIQRRVLCEDE